MYNDFDINNILMQVEQVETQKEFVYNEQKGISAKPTLVYSGESLQKYSHAIKLHADFCNPQEIINYLDNMATNTEVFPYFKNGNYVGDFVINGLKITEESVYSNDIIYAEVVVDIIEAGESDNAEYEPQTVKKIEIEESKIQSLSAKICDKLDIVASYADKATTAVTDKTQIVEKAMTTAMSDVSNLAKKAVLVVSTPTQKMTSFYEKLTPSALNVILRRATNANI